MLDLCWGKIRLVFAGGKWEYPEQTPKSKLKVYFWDADWKIKRQA